MTYSESAKGITISHGRAIKEIKKHITPNAEDLADFYKTCGKKEKYKATAVLAWLGY